MKAILGLFSKIAAVADPVARWGGDGARNMKTMQPPLVAIFFMTRGCHGPLSPLDLLLSNIAALGLK